MTMPLTPQDSRVIHAKPTIKLTPSLATHPRRSGSRSPTRSAKYEVNLSLRRVIGTTAASRNTIDSIPSRNTFAFTAGAAAVVATVHQDNQSVNDQITETNNGQKSFITQRFYRAPPILNASVTSPSSYGSPTSNGTPTHTRRVLREPNTAVNSPTHITSLSQAPEWVDSPTNKTWTSKDRIRAATAVALSPDGRFLAVGETGYKPRLLIFSRAESSSTDCPVSCLSEHAFSIRCLSFSSDSRYLASLGSPNDGFLHIWSINARTGDATLHSSNRCTSSVRQIAWMGRSLVSVGTRHVKVWRPVNLKIDLPLTKRVNDPMTDSAGADLKTLSGRNCILGDMQEAVFKTVSVISTSEAIVCSSKGDVCLLEDNEGSQRIHKIAETGFEIAASAVDTSNRFLVSGVDGRVARIAIEDLIYTDNTKEAQFSDVWSRESADKSLRHQVALVSLDCGMVTVDDHCSIQLLILDSQNHQNQHDKILYKLPAHGNAVLGVKGLSAPNAFDASFFSWSANGHVMFWNESGVLEKLIELELPLPLEDDSGVLNEIKMVSVSKDVSLLLSGDTYGTIRVQYTDQRLPIITLKAHDSEITDLALLEKNDRFLVASSARDRTIQIYALKDDRMSLIQTLNEHSGAVTGLLFASGGKKLISRSSDRTVIVRDYLCRQKNEENLEGFVPVRTITVKAAPASMCLNSSGDRQIWVTTMDRQVHRVDIESGIILRSYRAADGEHGDAVVICSLLNMMTPSGHSITAGVSSTDKSLRLYDESGTLLSREWGHSEGISTVALIRRTGKEEEKGSSITIVTAAVDGTIFLWDVTSKASDTTMLMQSLDALSLGNNQTDKFQKQLPLRRVFSQSELARLQQTDTYTFSRAGIPSLTPALRKKGSACSLKSQARVDQLSSQRRGIDFLIAPIKSESNLMRRRSSLRQRSPSPPSSHQPSPTPLGQRDSRRISRARQSYADSTSRIRGSIGVSGINSVSGNSAGAGAGASLGGPASSTNQVCRTLRMYRKLLASTTGTLETDAIGELEMELELTTKAVTEHMANCTAGVDENTMARLFDRCSDKLVELLDERLAVVSKSRQSTVEPG